MLTGTRSSRSQPLQVEAGESILSRSLASETHWNQEQEVSSSSLSLQGSLLIRLNIMTAGKEETFAEPTSILTAGKEGWV